MDESKPINLKEFKTAITDVSDQEIESVKAGLLNSIDRLLDTNLELANEITKVRSKLTQLKPEEGHDDLRDDLLLFMDTIKENNHVVVEQVDRVKAANSEMVARGTMMNTTKSSQEELLDSRVNTFLSMVEKEMGANVVWNLVNDDTKEENEDGKQESKQETDPKIELVEEKEHTSSEDGVYL